MGSRYKKLVDIEGVKWSKECPVLLLKGALLHDDAKEENLLQLKFQSITNDTLAGMEIEYKAYSMGDELLLEERFSYLDLNVNLNDEFGEKTAIYLQNSDARKFSFSVKKVFFANGEIWENTEILKDIESQHSIKSALGDLYNQFQREYKAVSSHKNAEYLPIMGDSSWQCTCGSLNLGTFDTCRCCRIAKKKLLAILDREYLLEANEKFEEEEKRRREKEEIENAERQEEERILKKKKEKKKKKIIFISAISSCITILTVFVVYALINFIIPNVKYLDAEKEFASGNYEVAVDKFESLKDYKDSEEKLIESKYFWACEKYGDNLYAEAQKVFIEIDSYKDSSEFLKKCENYINYNKAKELYTKGNYGSARMLLESLPSGFEDAEEILLKMKADEQRIKADERREKYKEAKVLIDEKQYAKAYDILSSLNAYRDEFPKLYALLKKVKILELGRIKKWKEDGGKNQITVTGRKVKVKIKYTAYTAKGLEDKVANYTGKISYKKSTPYKIAIVHSGKVDYILVDNSVYNIFKNGCVEYEVYDEKSWDVITLYSKKEKK